MIWFDAHFKALKDLFHNLDDPEYDRINTRSNFRKERNELSLLHDGFTKSAEKKKKNKNKKRCFFSLPTLHPNMSEMVLLVHATLQWHNIGETQSKFLMLGDMLSVPGLLRSVSDRTGPWRVLPYTLAADWSWHAPSSLGSVRASLRALSGLAERVAERGAPEQPCCLWRALRWEGWRWRGGRDGLKTRRGKDEWDDLLQRWMRRSASAMLYSDGGNCHSPATDCPSKAQAGKKKTEEEKKREREQRGGARWCFEGLDRENSNSFGSQEPLIVQPKRKSGVFLAELLGMNIYLL